MVLEETSELPTLLLQVSTPTGSLREWPFTSVTGQEGGTAEDPTTGHPCLFWGPHMPLAREVPSPQESHALKEHALVPQPPGFIYLLFPKR